MSRAQALRRKRRKMSNLKITIIEMTYLMRDARVYPRGEGKMGKSLFAASAWGMSATVDA